MAKKKKQTRSRRRSRRVSGIGGNTMQILLGAAVGGVAAKVLIEQVSKTMPDLKPNAIMAAQIGLGGLAALKLKNPLLIGIGLGAVANGAVSAVQSFGIVAGVGAPGRNLITYSANPALSGLENTIAGDSYGASDFEDDDMGGMSILAGMQ